MKKLSKDKTWEVRVSVAKHLRTPPEILHSLAADKNEAVKEEAEKRLSSINI